MKAACRQHWSASNEMGRRANMTAFHCVADTRASAWTFDHVRPDRTDPYQPTVPCPSPETEMIPRRHRRRMRISRKTLTVCGHGASTRRLGRETFGDLPRALAEG